MARIADETSHRIHIRLGKSDYEWLKRVVGDDRLISETVRKLIKDLRQRYEELKTDDLLEMEIEDTDT